MSVVAICVSFGVSTLDVRPLARSLSGVVGGVVILWG